MSIFRVASNTGDKVLILRYLLLVIVGFSMFTVQGVLGAEPISNQQSIQHLIDQVGKTQIIEVIMKMRHGKITISKGAAFEDSYGRPNKDYISAQTVAEDLKKLNMDVSALESELGVHISKKEQQKERLSRVQDDIPSQEQPASKDGAGAQADSLMKLHAKLRREHDTTTDPDERLRLSEKMRAVWRDYQRESRKNTEAFMEEQRKQRAATLTKDPDYYCKKAKKNLKNVEASELEYKDSFRARREVTEEDRQAFIARYESSVQRECE